jgi:hypothetical protein
VPPPASVANHSANVLSSCELDLFANILCLDYVGTNSVTNPEMIHQVSDRLSHLSIVYQSRGQTHTCRVDDLFKTYLFEVPVLPDDTRLWGFTLTNYFWSALPEEMQCHIVENKFYSQPCSGHGHSCISKQSSSTPRSRRSSREDISDHDLKLARMISESLKKQQATEHPITLPPTASVHVPMISVAESVMTTQYSTPSPSAPLSATSPSPYAPAATTDTTDTSPVIDPIRLHQSSRS